MGATKDDAAREASGHLVQELHGVTLAHILEYLVSKVGWEMLHAHVAVRCFEVNPSIKSSLVFLRRTPWARQRVESLYVELRTQEVLASRQGG